MWAWLLLNATKLFGVSADILSLMTWLKKLLTSFRMRICPVSALGWLVRNVQMPCIGDPAYRCCFDRRRLCRRDRRGMPCKAFPNFDVCRQNAVGGVAWCFSYIIIFFDDLLRGHGADSQQSVLEVWVLAALRFALSPIFRTPLTFTVASARTIAAVTSVVTKLLTVYALNNA